MFPMHLSVGRMPTRARRASSACCATSAANTQRSRRCSWSAIARVPFSSCNDAILLELDATRRVREINARGSELLGAPAHGDPRAATGWISSAATPSANARALMLRARSPAADSREREFDALDVTGEPRRVYWRCIARRAADGSPAGWLCSGADVTDRAAREAHARLAQDRLTRVARLATVGEMAAGVAHEINQPLTAITTYARACARYLEMPEPDFAEAAARRVREIGAEGLRAGEIIRRLRQMVRTDGAEERAPLDVNTLHRGAALAAARRRAHARRAAAIVARRRDLPPVRRQRHASCSRWCSTWCAMPSRRCAEMPGRRARGRDRARAQRRRRGRDPRHRQWPRHRRRDRRQVVRSVHHHQGDRHRARPGDQPYHRAGASRYYRRPQRASRTARRSTCACRSRRKPWHEEESGDHGGGRRFGRAQCHARRCSSRWDSRARCTPRRRNSSPPINPRSPAAWCSTSACPA